MHVTIDSNEPAKIKNRFRELFEKEGYSVEIKKLEYGDYLTDRVIIERKTVGDLLASTMDNRYSRQFNNIATYAETSNVIPILFIHGYIDDTYELHYKLKQYPHPYKIYGAIASAMVRYGIYVLWIEDTNDAIRTLVSLVKKIDQEKWMRPHRRDELALLSRLLNLPKKTTVELLEICGGSIESLVMSDEETYMKVKGIGKKKASWIKEVLNSKMI